jgi:hypothetical protein
MQTAWTIWWYTDPGIVSYRGDSFRQLLQYLQYFEATDPRDHVYGLIGLWQHSQDSAELPQLLQPNYEKSSGEVLRDATRYAIQEAQDPRMLDIVNHRQRPAGHNSPSWVPRWDQGWDAHFDPAPLHYHFGADSSRDLLSMDLLNTSKHPNILLVASITIDVATNALFSLTQGTSVVEILTALLNVREALIAAGYSPNDSEIIMSSVLLAGTGSQGERIRPQAALEGYQAWKTHMESTGKISPSIADLTMSGETRPDLHSASEYDQAFLNARNNRFVFLTTEGRLGVGPKFTEAHDVVAILWGCTWPVILWPLERQDEYAFIGASYVHGIMDGEAVKEHEVARKEEQIFYLR